MNEDNQMWRDIHESRREKKRMNHDQSLALLDSLGVEYTALDPGVHYRVRDYDYWPSTGKFYNQKTKRKGRGVKNLLRILGVY